MKDRLLFLAVTLVGIALFAEWVTASHPTWVLVPYLGIGVVYAYRASYRTYAGWRWVLLFVLLLPSWLLDAMLMSVLMYLPPYRGYTVIQLMRRV